jgi:hypothetical protein
MLADSAKHIVHALVSAYLLSRRMGGFGQQRLLLTIGKTGLAALVMGITAALVTPPLAHWTQAYGLWSEIALVGLSGSLSVTVFVLMAILFKIEELSWLAVLLRRRLQGGK